jgi:predicted dehydrogenase
MDDAWRDSKILIAGCGSIGRRHARILSRLGVARIQVCDPIAEQVHAVQAEAPSVVVADSYEAGLADGPDAVFVLTPPKLHVPMISQAMDAGCHVFCEKPLSDTMEGVDDLAARVSASDRKIMVGLCFRYHEGLLKAKRMLDSGDFGRLVSIRAMMGEHLPDVRPDYRNLFTARYSGAFDLMHDIDLALWFAGQPVTEVKSIFGSFSDIGIEAPDTVEVLIAFAGRCVASVHLDFFQRPRRRQMELIGAEGVIIVEFASWDECTVSTYRSSKEGWERATMQTTRDDMFEAEDREFLKAITSDDPIVCDIREASRSVAVVAAAQSASRQGSCSGFGGIIG